MRIIIVALSFFAFEITSYSSLAADISTKAADWSKICKQRGRGAPACKADCYESGGSVSCDVYCADGNTISRCIVGLSCPGKLCNFLK
jgi:hypothetical protein